MNTSIYDLEALSIDGKIVPLQRFRDRVLLIVNTASACGFTPQFGGLEQLHQTYGERGLVVLGFPCNQFGSQDPGTNDEIEGFCQLNYGVTFPMMEQDRRQWRRCPPAVPLAHRRSPRPAGQQGHQMELHQVSGGQRRPGDQTLRTAGCAREAGERHRRRPWLPKSPERLSARTASRRSKSCKVFPGPSTNRCARHATVPALQLATRDSSTKRRGAVQIGDGDFKPDDGAGHAVFLRCRAVMRPTSMSHGC